MTDATSSNPKRPKGFKSPLPFIYAMMLNDCREVAESHGYALALHGSMINDIDLVAIPWANVVSPHDVFLSDLFGKVKHLMVMTFDPTLNGPEIKPHGRIAYSICVYPGMKIDISITPIVSAENTK